MLWSLNYLENHVASADDLEAEPSSKPHPEIFDEMECVVVDRALVYLYLGLLHDSSMAISLIVHGPFCSFLLKERPSVNNTFCLQRVSVMGCWVFHLLLINS